MSKKREPQSSYPSSKRFKTEDPPIGKIYGLKETLDQLSKKNKVEGLDLLPETMEPLKETKKSGIYTQLGHSIVNRLGDLDRFNGINFSDIREAGGAYFPQTKEIVFNSALVDQGLELIKTISHEGTHAIDHLNINIGSSIAVPFLAKLEKERGGINLLERENARNWYTQAQDIIGSVDFSESYGFQSAPKFFTKKEKQQKKLNDLSERLNKATFDSPGFSLEDTEVLNKLHESREQMTQVVEAIDELGGDKEALRFVEEVNSLIKEVKGNELSVYSIFLQEEAENYGIKNLQLEKDKLSKLVPNEDINSFSDVENLLKEKTKEEKIENILFHKPFTEFAAYAVENIDQEWNIGNDPEIKETYWKNIDGGRKLLRRIVKGVYRDFRANDPEFADNTKYSDANNAFLDRLTQLRNYEKHNNTTEGDYRDLLEKRFNERLPHTTP